VSALKLNVDFSDAGFNGGSAAVHFGDLRICGLMTTAGFNGSTVRDFLAAANIALGGGTAAYSFADLDALTTNLNFSFEAGTVSTFAQDHLFNGACPCTPGTAGCGWQNGQLTTFGQATWGDPTSNAAMILSSNFNTVYASTFGTLEVGIPGTAGFSILFSRAQAVLDYLPQAAAIGALTTDLIDPASSSSGAFGGEVTALRLNVDFSDAGDLPGTSKLKFGDLTLCGFSGAVVGLNGTTVRALLGTTSTLLGGGSTSFAIADVYPVTVSVNAGFQAGTASSFAQSHLFNGACP
jgi:hypothetical protein